MSIRRLTSRAAGVAVVVAAGILGASVLPATVAAAAPSPDAGSAFTPLAAQRPTGEHVRVRPTRFAASRVDLRRARAQLAAAQAEGQGAGAPFVVRAPGGEQQRFVVWRTSIMQAGLAARHPEITTYAGRGVTDPHATIALDQTPMGLHASVRGPGGQRAWYVDPAYNRRGSTTHLSYFGADVPRSAGDFVERDAQETAEIDAGAPAPARTDGGVVLRRDFRLALTSDPSYAAYFGSANVLAEKVTLINRVNQVYNDDVAVRLRLVNATDALNLDTEAKATGANGPCGSSPCFDPAEGVAGQPGYVPGQLDFCDVGTLGRNRTVLGQLVGAENYDIGHIVLGKNGGGVAYLGVVGWDYKGAGCTGLPQPVGDFMAIDYVAHEMGHEFGGNHTFNGCGPGNRNGATSVEPGSGSSVMAYAGICGRDNLQPHSDPYFSQRSIEEIQTAFTRHRRVTEVQTLSLRGFDRDGDSITLGFGDRQATITRGAGYTGAAIGRAVARLTGHVVTIAPWGYAPLNTGRRAPGEPDDRGFQIIFNDDPNPFAPGPHDDVPTVSVASASAGVSGFVGVTADGGPAENGGQVVTATGDHAPVVTAPAARTLPVRTPFALTASATDADGDPLTYLWEQNDIGADDRFAHGGVAFYGGTPLLSNDKRTGPLFRVFGVAAQVSDEAALQSPSPGENIADGNPTRVFPDMAQILIGNTNAVSGRCPTLPKGPGAVIPQAVVDCFSEFLPRRDYIGSYDATSPSMNFRVTVRDGYPNGGGVSHADVRLALDPDAGPLLLTSQAGGAAVPSGSALRVTWAVNGTDRADLAPDVRILLSTDNGQTFDRVLAAETPNDGTQTVRLPGVAANRARIKLEAVGNYFFTVNGAPFAITR